MSALTILPLDLDIQLTNAFGDSCRICPRACGAARTQGKRGICGADATLDIAHAQLHLWEEPPISGDTGSGTVFFKYCNLGCVYCQNYRISGGASEDGIPLSSADMPDAYTSERTKKDIDSDNVIDVDVSVAQAATLFLELQQRRAMNINLVTPTHYAPIVRHAIACARERGLSIPVIWNTSSFENVEQICANTGFVDVYLADMKYADEKLALALSGAKDYPSVALAAIEAMVETTLSLSFDEYNGCERLVSGVVARHMILPGHLDDSKRIVAMLHENFGKRIKLSLMNQYTPVLTTRAAAGDVAAQAMLKAHPELAGVVTKDEYEQLLDFADALGVEDYFWQDGVTCEESFIPDFDTSQHVFDISI